MDRCQECFGLALCFFIFLTDPGFAASIIEGPKNVTVLAGSAAHFNCTVSPGWDVLIWLFNGNPRLTLLSDGKTYAHPGYSQKNYSLDTMFTSELTISNVQMSNSGQIKCSIQGNNDDMYAFLTVQVNGSLTINTSNVTVRKNQTVEVTCEALGWAPAPQISWTGSNILINDSMYITYPSQGSNGLYNEESILTLTPMTNVTVTCLATIDALSKPQNASANITVITVIEPPPKPNYQKEVQRNVSEKKTNGNLETARGSGYDNRSYSPEDMLGEQMSGNPTLPKMRSSVYFLNKDLDVSPSQKVPQNRCDEAVPSRTSAYPTKPRKIRNVTHV